MVPLSLAFGSKHFLPTQSSQETLWGGGRLSEQMEVFYEGIYTRLSLHEELLLQSLIYISAKLHMVRCTGAINININCKKSSTYMHLWNQAALIGWRF